jgi:NMD protein affecting ribosome stability and mRNA decay
MKGGAPMSAKAYNETSRASRKTVLEEKGMRTVRSTDVYLPKEGLKEVSYCRKCGIIYQNKRWYMDEAELAKVKAIPDSGKVVCPSCQRMQDNNPGGIVTLSGEYMHQHEVEILDLLKHKESYYRAKNPLGRIMEINQEGNVLTISTTEDKLAQKLGRDVYKAHKGALHYKWNHDESFVRVSWIR